MEQLQPRYISPDDLEPGENINQVNGSAKPTTTTAMTDVESSITALQDPPTTTLQGPEFQPRHSKRTTKRKAPDIIRPHSEVLAWWGGVEYLIRQYCTRTIMDDLTWYRIDISVCALLQLRVILSD